MVPPFRGQRGYNRAKKLFKAFKNVSTQLLLTIILNHNHYLYYMYCRPVFRTSNSILKQYSHALALLSFYLFAFLVPQGTLPHVHSRTDLHAGDSCRKDACHIAIFHPGDKGGCHHKYHFTQAEDQCPFCNGSYTYQIRPAVTLLPTLVQHQYAITNHQVYRPIPASLILHADRGPPVA